MDIQTAAMMTAAPLPPSCPDRHLAEVVLRSVRYHKREISDLIVMCEQAEEMETAALLRDFEPSIDKLIQALGRRALPPL